MVKNVSPAASNVVDKTYTLYSHSLYLQQHKTCVTKDVKKQSHLDRLIKLKCIFEEATKTIIPAAEHWDEQMWLNVYNIISAIQDRYGKDSASILENFDAVIDYLSCKIRKNRSALFFVSVIRINDMPDSLQRQLWPGNTVDAVCKLFLSTCYALSKETSDCNILFARMDFKESWIYRQVQTWIAEGADFKDPCKIRKAFMDITFLS